MVDAMFSIFILATSSLIVFMSSIKFMSEIYEKDALNSNKPLIVITINLLVMILNAIIFISILSK